MRKAVFFAAFLTAFVLQTRWGDAGTISGTVTNPEKCHGVQVLRRISDNPLNPVVINASFDAKTGVFNSPELQPGIYDLRVLIEGGLLEGVDMRVETPDGETAGELEDPDRLAVIQQVAKMNEVFSYMNTHRALCVRGNSLRTAVLVEQIRHEPAVGRPKDEVTWRVEVWRYENHTGAWVRPRGSRGRYVPIRRLRIPADMPTDKFRNWIVLFSPEIGGLEVAEGKSLADVSVTIPEPDMSMGKVPGSVAQQIEEDRKQNPSRYD